MKRNGKKWYLVAYDIRQDKRLRRLHYYLKKEAVALQKSVFLLHADKVQLRDVIAEIKLRVNGREDDVRLYPIHYPNAIWSAGMQVMALQSLYTAASKKQPTSVGFKGFLKKYFRG
jgi:CRISPR-associated protein Cas2